MLLEGAMVYNKLQYIQLNCSPAASSSNIEKIIVWQSCLIFKDLQFCVNSFQKYPLLEDLTLLTPPSGVVQNYFFSKNKSVECTIQ